ncbi:MAG: phosphate acyltransferase, partial [candidate division Zixibacteria bacterium]|nr:phosphate acyltransferase [candidate division Zixibacteria bacterium]
MPVKSKKSKDIIELMKIKARAKKRKVVLPEGTEPRMIEAAKKIIAEKIAGVTLLGNKDEISRLAKKIGLKTDLVEIIDPAISEHLPSFAQELYELRKEKGLTEQEALKTMKNVLYFGAMMVRRGMADGSVAGSINTTGDVLRAAI